MTKELTPFGADEMVEVTPVMEAGSLFCVQTSTQADGWIYDDIARLQGEEADSLDSLS
jgi:hypothetical protein